MHFANGMSYDLYFHFFSGPALDPQAILVDDELLSLMMPAIDTIIVSCSSDTGLIIIEGKLKASEHRTINLKDDSRFKLKFEGGNCIASLS